MLWQVLSLLLAPVTGHNERIVAVLHALVPVVFGFEHVEGYGNVSALDLAVFANTQRPQYENMNKVHQFPPAATPFSLHFSATQPRDKNGGEGAERENTDKQKSTEVEFPSHEEEHKLGEHRKEKSEEHPAD